MTGVSLGLSCSCHAAEPPKGRELEIGDFRGERFKFSASVSQGLHLADDRSGDAGRHNVERAVRFGEVRWRIGRLVSGIALGGQDSGRTRLHSWY